MTQFTELQKGILNIAGAFFNMAVEASEQGNRSVHSEAIAMYNKYLDQVIEETGCETWEVINEMGV